MRCRRFNTLLALRLTNLPPNISSAEGRHIRGAASPSGMDIYICISTGESGVTPDSRVLIYVCEYVCTWLYV